MFLKNTLHYELNVLKPINLSHFNFMKHIHIRDSYTEHFRIKSITGYFSWNYDRKNNSEITMISIKHDFSKKILFETTKNDSYTYIGLIDNGLCHTISKKQIKRDILDMLIEKNDSHIISCSCCVRKF